MTHINLAKVSCYPNLFIVSFVESSSSGLAIIMTGLLTLRFYSWYKSSRNTVILAYGLAAATLSAELKRHLLKILLLTSESIQTEDGECGGYVQKFSSFSLVS
jgi:hypothetical protein